MNVNYQKLTTDVQNSTADVHYDIDDIDTLVYYQQSTGFEGDLIPKPDNMASTQVEAHNYTNSSHEDANTSASNLPEEGCHTLKINDPLIKDIIDYTGQNYEKVPNLVSSISSKKCTYFQHMYQKLCEANERITSYVYDRPPKGLQETIKSFILTNFDIPKNIRNAVNDKLNEYFINDTKTVNPSVMYNPNEHMLILANFGNQKNQMVCYKDKVNNVYMFPSLFCSYKKKPDDNNTIEINAFFSSDIKCKSNYWLTAKYNINDGNVMPSHTLVHVDDLLRLSHVTCKICSNMAISALVVCDKDLGNVNETFNIIDYKKINGNTNGEYEFNGNTNGEYKCKDIDISNIYTIIKPNYTFGLLWNNKKTSIVYMLNTVDELFAISYDGKITGVEVYSYRVKYNHDDKYINDTINNAPAINTVTYEAANISTTNVQYEENVFIVNINDLTVLTDDNIQKCNMKYVCHYDVQCHQINIYKISLECGTVDMKIFVHNEINALKLKCNELTQCNDVLQTRNDVLQTRNNELTQLVKNLNAHIEKLTKEYNKLNDEIQAENISVKNDYQNLKNDYQIMKNDCQIAYDTLHQKQQELNQVKQTNQILQSTIDQLHDELDQIQQNFNQKCHELDQLRNKSKHFKKTPTPPQSTTIKTTYANNTNTAQYKSDTEINSTAETTETK